MRITEVFGRGQDYDPFDIDWEDAKSIAEKIKQDCKPFLSNWSYDQKKRYGLFKGISAKNMKEFMEWDWSGRSEDRIWSNKDETKQLHELMKKDGFTATRLSGVFTFPVPGNGKPEMFGELYVVIPAGNYSITWQKIPFQIDGGDGKWIALTKDVIQEFIDPMGLEAVKKDQVDQQALEYWSNVWDKNREAIKLGIPTDEEFHYANAYWDIFGQNWTYGTDVNEAIKSKNEVMIYADHFKLVTDEAWTLVRSQL